ncbi:hypothetical protein QVD17_13638 [Tagetes erecta]|uniref:Uncharacterized protein n=1 Tax=Tagetes erecta TaxID=13708 RepID=A0AAD8P3E0_TARER|nr:hypothetical protein QVD17_13638 [Tagetes erecta]
MKVHTCVLSKALCATRQLLLSAHHAFSSSIAISLTFHVYFAQANKFTATISGGVPVAFFRRLFPTLQALIRR